MISEERKNKYISAKNLFKISKRAGVNKICLADLLKTHLGVEMDREMGNLPMDEPCHALMNSVVPLTN